jgi:DNA-binding MarR family transcriptional regulator
MTKIPQPETNQQQPPPAPPSEAVKELPFMELPYVSRAKDAKSGTKSAERQHPVGGEIRQTHLAFKNLLHQKLRARNVTSAQWAFLRILWNEDGLNQKDVARRVGVHQTTAVPAISILERNGYVRRERSSEDKRNVFVYLTDAGKLLAHELIPFASEINQNSLAGISPEDADKLMELLLKIQRNLQAVP